MLSPVDSIALMSLETGQIRSFFALNLPNQKKDLDLRYLKMSCP